MLINTWGAVNVWADIIPPIEPIDINTDSLLLLDVSVSYKLIDNTIKYRIADDN